MIILDHRTIKFHCLQAYILVQLEGAEKNTAEGKGKMCINEKYVNVDDVANGCGEIAQKIKANGNTYEALGLLASRLSCASDYYNCIGHTIKKHFKVGEPWIPSLLGLTLLQEYTLRGHKGFENIDFSYLLSGFDGVEGNNIKTHYECALDVLDTLIKMKPKKKKSSKKKKKIINNML